MVLTEPELFAYLKEFYYPDLEMSEDKHSKHDCISDAERLYIELKSRNTHYDDLLIEQIKYAALIEEAAKHNHYYPLYICATPAGIWKFDLFLMGDIKWEERWLPQNTEFSARGNKTKVVGYLHIKDGQQL